jgi:hypothetical protein
MLQSKHLDALAETLGWFGLNSWMILLKILDDSDETLG